ncbi:hypothetical protein R1sor_023540 [Riccia sorocarpa]|uniref:Uncharacterized protein n=1 Tax=Riccia sorocarpa TaxID=122646 RepID=A0ABD3GTX1_9MARC
MYWLERYMKVMKDDVRQKARPEGSQFVLHNNAIMEEWTAVYEDERRGALASRRRGRPVRFPSLRDFMREKLLQPEAVEESSGLYPPITEDIRILVRGPTDTVTVYKQCWHEARHFRVRSLDEKKIRTADSCVTCTFMQECRASGNDQNIQQEEIPYFGWLEEILELDFLDFT